MYSLFWMRSSKLEMNWNNFLIFHTSNANSMKVTTNVNDEFKIFIYSPMVSASNIKNRTEQTISQVSQNSPTTFFTLNGYFSTDWDGVIPNLDKDSCVDSKIFIVDEWTMNLTMQTECCDANAKGNLMYLVLYSLCRRIYNWLIKLKPRNDLI